MFAAASGNMVQVIASYTCATLHTLRGLKGKVKVKPRTKGLVDRSVCLFLSTLLPVGCGCPHCLGDGVVTGRQTVVHRI